ncbi:MAG TPA: CHASE2 domain-containing protein [Chthoniobacteraceae bacterium]|nr:CHASE2 domain-containing protein [Chthoniobacteraceae bacterium]
MFRTGAQLMFFTLIVGIVLTRESGRDPLKAADERFVDFLAANARRKEVQPPVAVVAIDDISLREHPRPWTPGDYALFFNAANSFRPEFLATDEILDWDAAKLPPENQQTFAQYAQLLRENLRKSPRVLLGAELSFPEDADRLPPLESIAGLRHVTGNVAAIPEFRVIEFQAAEDLRLASVQGFSTLPKATGSTRSIPLVLRYCGQVVPTFVLQAAMLWEKVTPDEVEVVLGQHISLGGRINIPIDEAGRMRVNLAVPFDKCSFEDLVVSAEQREAKSRTVIPAGLLSDKAVLLTRTDRDTPLISIALDRPRPRGELFALALGTIQTRAFIHAPPIWTNWAIVAFFTIAAGFVPWLRRSQTVILGLVAILAVSVAALALIGMKLLAVPVVVPVGLSLFLIIARLLTPDSRRDKLPVPAPEPAKKASQPTPPAAAEKEAPREPVKESANP